MLLPCPTTMGVVIPFCWRAGSLCLLGGNVLSKAQCRFWGNRGSSGLSPSYRTEHAFFPPKQMGFEPESSVSVDRTCGSSPRLFLRREVMCVWELKTQVTLDSNKYKPYNNELLSECRSTGSHSGILASLFSVALLSSWVWGKEIVFMLLAFRKNTQVRSPRKNTENCSASLSLSISVSYLTPEL